MKANFKEQYFSSADGKKIDLYEYSPKNKIHSSIILVYEIFGKTEHIHNFAIKLASEGILVHVPDIFSRFKSKMIFPYSKEGFQEGIKIKESLGWQIPVMDIVSCAALLKKKYSVNIMGFCYGASLSWIATQKSFIFEKAICYYGSDIHNFLNKKINCSTTLHLGKEDKGIPENLVKKIKEYALNQNYSVDIFEYDNADHGFNCEDREHYSSDASSLSFKRSLDFLKGLQ